MVLLSGRWHLGHETIERVLKAMINREAGVFQPSYRSDMALYTLPLAKNHGLGNPRASAPPAAAASARNTSTPMSIVNTIALAASVLSGSIF